MSEYIEREAALAALCIGCDKMVPSDEREPCRYRFTGCMEYYNIFDLAAADARPMVHGQWNEKCPDYLDGDSIYVCSVCGETWDLEAGTPKENNMNFCPNCGAKMDL